MSTKATKIVLCLLLMVGIYLQTAQAQITFDTGKIGVRLSSAGSIRLYAPTTNDYRQLDRINIIAALSEQAVCDYNEDQDVAIDAYLLASPTTAEIEAIAVYDNGYSNLPPEVTFKAHLYAWSNDPYLIAQYTVINDSSEQVTLHLGLLTVPRISGSYGGETNNYDATHQIAYCYREGETPHAGFRLLSKEPFSYHALDWNVYSPADPNADVATDSTRYHQTADPGFDAAMTAGGDGSIYSLNAGAFTIAAGDSVMLTYAIVYADGLPDLLTSADAAKARYDNIIVAVDREAPTKIPTTCSLHQNYPNPFNPTTTISFDLAEAGDVKLAIYNVKGELVNMIASGKHGAGTHTAAWNGVDRNSQPAGSGVYFYRLTTDKISLTKKMLMVQ